MDAVEGLANSDAGDVKTQKLVDVSNLDSIPNYAYPCDNYIDTILENKLTRHTLRAIATKYYGKQIKDIILNGSEVSAKNYPHLFANYQDCCKTLNIANPPKVFVTSCLSGVNALSVEVMDNEPIILLSFMSVAGLNDLEQKFLLGHELGHIQMGHMLAHTVQGLLQDFNSRVELLGPIVTDLIDVPLNRWYRTSEFTADRAGYLCCRDISTIRRLFNRLGDDAPVNAFEQFKELSDAYPLMATRMAQLLQYTQL